jgi:hypothetical protein
LILIKATASVCRHDVCMPSHTAWSHPVPNSSKIAERLRAHARLCRQIAAQSWNQEVAERLEELAEECSRAADDAEGRETIPRRMH